MMKSILPLTLRAMCVAAALLAAGCERANHGYSAPQLTEGLRRLLKANEGAKVIICDSSPKTRACGAACPAVTAPG